MQPDEAFGDTRAAQTSFTRLHDGFAAVRTYENATVDVEPLDHFAHPRCTALGIPFDERMHA
jgi:hypothetical protein